MTILRRSPLNDSIALILQAELQDFLDGNVGVNLNSAVKTALQNQVTELLNSYIGIGYSLIGLWDYDTDTHAFSYTGLSDIFENKLLKYYPYLKVLNDEFIAITGKESIQKQYIDNGSKTENNSRNKNLQRADTFQNDTNGTNRSAHEESPITTAPINSSPTSASEWNLSNPISKDGEQFNHHNQSSNTRADIHTEQEALAETNQIAGNSTEMIENPETMLKVLRFNIEDLNISRIARLLIDSVVEEKNTIY